MPGSGHTRTGSVRWRKKRPIPGWQSPQGLPMIIGVPREVKNNEFRVALVPAGAEMLVEDGHTVLVEAGAGLGTSIGDSEYVSAGAKIVREPAELFAQAEMIVKVKEPMPAEYP